MSTLKKITARSASKLKQIPITVGSLIVGEWFRVPTGSQLYCYTGAQLVHVNAINICEGTTCFFKHDREVVYIEEVDINLAKEKQFL